MAACISDDITDRRVVSSGLLITDITLTSDTCGVPEENTLMVTILGDDIVIQLRSRYVELHYLLIKSVVREIDGWNEVLFLLATHQNRSKSRCFKCTVISAATFD